MSSTHLRHSFYSSLLICVKTFSCIRCTASTAEEGISGRGLILSSDAATSAREDDEITGSRGESVGVSSYTGSTISREDSSSWAASASPFLALDQQSLAQWLGLPQLWHVSRPTDSSHEPEFAPLFRSPLWPLPLPRQHPQPPPPPEPLDLPFSLAFIRALHSSVNSSHPLASTARDVDGFFLCSIARR
jgi:hypothetical protein